MTAVIKGDDLAQDGLNELNDSLRWTPRRLAIEISSILLYFVFCRLSTAVSPNLIAFLCKQTSGSILNRL
jgi:hypothetical protein